ncbi:MAG: HAD hydrolase-like protein [Acidobacteriota bacterium]|nr:HAD hydrolase-like protein [Acidobacteriota bacterium]
MRSLPRHVIFDLDGTLADSSQGIVGSFRATLDEIGLAATPEVLARLIGPPLGESFRILGVAEEDIDDVVALYREHYARHGVFAARLYDGVAECVDELADRGVRLGVATAKRVDFAEQMLAALGVARHFEHVAGASLDLRVTAKYEIMSEVLAQWDHPDADDVWMVGDRHYDMVAARRHGVHAVGALWGFGSAEELTAAGAQWLVTRPSRLLDPEEEAGSPVCLLDEVCDVCGGVRDDTHDPTHDPVHDVVGGDARGDITTPR